MMNTDKSLIEAHCRGDQKAFGEIINRYGDSVLGYLKNMQKTFFRRLSREFTKSLIPSRVLNSKAGCSKSPQM
jgi:hypothetical protein